MQGSQPDPRPRSRPGRAPTVALTLAAVLTLAPAAGLAGCRQSDPVAPLPGRLLLTTPSPAHGSDLLVALDAATGESTALWPLFAGADTGYEAHDWAVAPDGRQMAYLGKGGTGDARILVRELTPGAPARVHAVPGGTADVLQWLPDGQGLVYGRLDIQGAADTGLARVARWELRQLDPGTGEDREVVALDAAALGGRFPRLAGYDAAAGRAALLLGPGENFFVDTLRLLDTRTGETVADLTTMDEGFVAAAAPNGKEVGFGECAGCNAAGLGEIKVLSLASGLESVARLALGEKVVGLRWSPTGQQLAWTLYRREAADGDARHGLGRARRTLDAWEVLAVEGSVGSAVAFSPDGGWLLGSRGVVELATGRSRPLPWAPPPGVTWDEAPWRVVGWAR